MKSVQELANENVQQVLNEGPGIRYSTNIFIIAKDLPHGLVKLGGLGGMGIGQMWVSHCEHLEEYTGYEEAPDINITTHRARLNYVTGEIEVWEEPTTGQFE